MDDVRAAPGGVYRLTEAQADVVFADHGPSGMPAPDLPMWRQWIGSREATIAAAQCGVVISVHDRTDYRLSVRAVEWDLEPDPASSTSTATSTDESEPAIWALLDAAHAAREPVLLAGSPGAGKSYQAERWARDRGLDPLVVPCTRRTEPDDLLGCIGLRDGSTHTELRALGIAARDGRCVVLDELDMLGPEAAAALHAPTNRRHAYVALPWGERIDPKDGYCVVGTANTDLTGDTTGMYSGAQRQNAALRDRFLVIPVDPPSTDEVVRWAMSDTGAPDTADVRAFAEFVCKSAEHLRSRDGVPPVGPRAVIRAIALWRAGLPAREAYVSALISGDADRAGARTALQALAFEGWFEGRQHLDSLER